MAWKDGYSAVILNAEITREEYFGVLDVVRSNSGAIAIETERVLLGWIPRPATGKIRTTTGVRAVLHEAVARPEELVDRADALAPLLFYNRVMRGEYDDIIEAGLGEDDPLTGCVRPRRSGTGQIEAQGVRDSRLRPTPGDVTAQWEGRLPLQNPDMRGRVTVQFFRLDSNGTIDADEYTWTGAHLQYSLEQFFGAFNVWASAASQRSIPLSFRIKVMDPFNRYTRTYRPTPTQYEPIRHVSTDDYKWVNDALTPQGYGSPDITETDVFTRHESFNAFWKGDPAYGPFERSFSVYIVYNPVAQGAPRVFADDWRSYAMYDGPFTTILWNNGFLTETSLQKLINHETGHIFWACDEYDCICQNCHFDKGPRNQITTPWITNGNCSSTCGPIASCIMRSQLNASVCSHTALQIGW